MSFLQMGLCTVIWHHRRSLMHITEDCRWLSSAAQGASDAIRIGLGQMPTWRSSWRKCIFRLTMAPPVYPPCCFRWSSPSTARNVRQVRAERLLDRQAATGCTKAKSRCCRPAQIADSSWFAPDKVKFSGNSQENCKAVH